MQLSDCQPKPDFSLVEAAHDFHGDRNVDEDSTKVYARTGVIQYSFGKDYPQSLFWVMVQLINVIKPPIHLGRRELLFWRSSRELRLERSRT